MNFFFLIFDIHLDHDYGFSSSFLYVSLHSKESWLHKSPVKSCPLPHLSPLYPSSATRYPSYCTEPRFDLSQSCRHPLINVQEQPSWYAHRSFWQYGEDSPESCWLFLSVLGRTSGITSREFFVSSMISIWIVPGIHTYVSVCCFICHILYIFLFLHIIRKHYNNKM